VATRMGLPRNDEDFGQTLGAWGVDSGPFVMLPFFGPSTVRDAGGRAADGLAGYSYRSQMDHVPSRNTATGVDVVDTRAGLLSQERLIRGDKYRSSAMPGCRTANSRSGMGRSRMTSRQVACRGG